MALGDSLVDRLLGSPRRATHTVPLNNLVGHAAHATLASVVFVGARAHDGPLIL